MSSRHVIESLSISSAIHFRDITLTFDERLTCIIGGRGTGKSGVLHLIRFALGAGRVTVGARTKHGVRYAS